MLEYRGFRRSERVGDVWKFRGPARGWRRGIEGGERRHLAGRETLITLGMCEGLGAAQWLRLFAWFWELEITFWFRSG